MTDNDDEFSAVILTFSGGPSGARNQTEIHCIIHQLILTYTNSR